VQGNAMQRIEATVRIDNDRQLILQLPKTVPADEHRVVVILEEQAESEESPTRWEGNVLVYNGTIGESLETSCTKCAKNASNSSCLPSRSRESPHGHFGARCGCPPRASSAWRRPTLA
jgi:hypothetical protein